MKIADRTPFRSEDGKINLFGRVQGILNFGMTWNNRLKAQDIVIAILDKILDANFVLLRNITLPNTEIDLPMVLIGPPGVYMINVTHERGVYRVKDDEWGTISGTKFEPAEINQVQRTAKLGRALQIYLDRSGFKDAFIVDPILMAADPGMHIEAVRPVVRIVLSDALERFANSLSQAPAILSKDAIWEIARVIANGPKKQEPEPRLPASKPPEQKPNTSADFSAGFTDYSFDEAALKQQYPGFSGVRPQDADATIINFSETSNSLELAALPEKAVAKKKGLFGLTTTQILILAGIMLFWLCALGLFAIMIFNTLNA